MPITSPSWKFQKNHLVYTMKKHFLLPLSLLVLPLSFLSCEPASEEESEPLTDNIYIPDEHFKHALVHSAVVDSNGDGLGDTDVDSNNDLEIQRNEAEGIQSLILYFDYENIVRYIDLTGIEHFINLKTLKITGERIYDLEKPDPLLLNYDFTSLKKLESLQVNHLGSNYFQTLDLRGLSNLTVLDLSFNRPTWFEEEYKIPQNFIAVKMQGVNDLTDMSFPNSFLYVDFCEVPMLEFLDMRYLEGGEPEVFDFHSLPHLERLDISENFIKSLFLKNSSVLNSLQVDDIGSADNAYLPAVEYICIDDIPEEWDQISTLVDENTVITTDCTF